jgi:stage IV sporulation protein A
LNSASPYSAEAIELGHTLEEKYGVPVALVNCLELDGEDIGHILEMILSEFPITEMEFSLPEWTASLTKNHRLTSEINEIICSIASKISKVCDLKEVFENIEVQDIVENISVMEMNMGDGKAKIKLDLKNELFYDIIREETGFEIYGENDLFPLLTELSVIKERYNKVAEALNDVEERGYGIVMPDVSELRLEEPEIVRKQNGYGVKLCASAQSIHMIRANIKTEVSPIVGTEQQSEELVKGMLGDFDGNKQAIWDTNIFGRSLSSLVADGIRSKLTSVPAEAEIKLKKTLGRIVNEGKGGVICILL